MDSNYQEDWRTVRPLRPAGCTDAMIAYLETMQAGGAVNVTLYGGMYLAGAFYISKELADRVVLYWQATFAVRKPTKKEAVR